MPRFVPAVRPRLGEGSGRGGFREDRHGADISVSPSLPDAEGGEDAVEEVFGGGFAGDFAEGLEGGNFLG